jgi:hypothetical protein
LALQVGKPRSARPGGQREGAGDGELCQPALELLTGAHGGAPWSMWTTILCMRVDMLEAANLTGGCGAAGHGSSSTSGQERVPPALATQRFIAHAGQSVQNFCMIYGLIGVFLV